MSSFSEADTTQAAPAPAPAPAETAAPAPAAIRRDGGTTQSTYYNKWDKFAKEEVAAVEKEEKEAKEKAAIDADGAIVSEAEKKDVDKRAALREAKKQWDNVKAIDDSKKVIIDGESSSNREITEGITTSGEFHDRRVLVFKKTTDCVFDIPEQSKLIKIFVEDCKDTVIRVCCSVTTGMMELTRCTNVTVEVAKHPIHTMQADLCESVKLRYGFELFSEASNSKVYHSGVKQLTIEYDWRGDGTDLRETVLDDFGLTEMAPAGSIAEKDVQFVTTFVAAEQQLVTDMVVRDSGGHPTTMREIEAAKQKIIAAALQKGVDLSTPSLQSFLQEYEPLTVLQQSRKYKDDGNTVFKDNDYMQASLYYSQAITALDAVNPTESPEAFEILVASYSNRAACSLKLGDHAQALADADACLLLEPNHVKSTFRKGMALHALKRYREACPVLGKALEQQPKNDQIKTALAFAERRAMQG